MVGKVGARGTLKERFEAKYIPEPNSGCWLWIGGIAKGYGVIHDGRQRPAHQIAWELEGFVIPDGLELDHKCKNRACVNPFHLEAVTHEENVRRGLAGAYQKAKTHCRKGHEYSAANTYFAKRGSRDCRACNRIAVAKYQKRVFT